MAFSLVAILLWAAGFLGNAALLAVLIVRRRVRLVPWFTTWVIFNLLYTVTLFCAFRLGTKHAYAVLYWSGAFLDLLLQVGMIIEIARYVFCNSGAWVQGATKRLVTAGVVSAIAAILLGWAMTPAASSHLEAVEARVDLGATAFITMLFTAVMSSSHRLGLSWRNLLLREGYGVAAWSVTSFLTDTLHACWRTAEHFTLLERLRIVLYLCALVYWIVVFWIPESIPLVPDSDEETGIESLLRRLE